VCSPCGSRTALLLDRAEPLVRDSPALRVTAASLRGAYELEHGSLETAYDVLVSAARTILRDEPARALEMLLRAADAAWWSGRLDRAAELGTLAAASAFDFLGPGAAEADDAVIALKEAATTDVNLMEPLIACARARCTEGEIVGALRQVFGEYTETPRF